MNTSFVQREIKTAIAKLREAHEAVTEDHVHSALDAARDAIRHCQKAEGELEHATHEPAEEGRR